MDLRDKIKLYSEGKTNWASNYGTIMVTLVVLNKKWTDEKCVLSLIDIPFSLHTAWCVQCIRHIYVWNRMVLCMSIKKCHKNVHYFLIIIHGTRSSLTQIYSQNENTENLNWNSKATQTLSATIKYFCMIEYAHARNCYQLVVAANDIVYKNASRWNGSQ